MPEGPSSLYGLPSPTAAIHKRICVFPILPVAGCRLSVVGLSLPHPIAPPPPPRLHQRRQDRHRRRRAARDTGGLAERARAGGGQLVAHFVRQRGDGAIVEVVGEAHALEAAEPLGLDLLAAEIALIFHHH